MAKFSRDKGKRGELAVSAIISDLTGWSVKRRVRQHDGDSDWKACQAGTVEVKNCATITLPAWWRQAVAQAGTTASPCCFTKCHAKAGVRSGPYLQWSITTSNYGMRLNIPVTQPSRRGPWWRVIWSK